MYNTKLGGAGAGAGPEAAAAAVDRLQAALNPTGAIMSRQLQLSREEASDALAEFLQEAAAAAKQHDAPRSLPDEFLSGGWAQVLVVCVCVHVVFVCAWVRSVAISWLACGSRATPKRWTALALPAGASC